MSAKRNIKMATDLVMTMLLPVLMAYSLVGEAIHEWLGIVMFLLFIVHQALNRQWYKNLFRGFTEYMFLRTQFVFYDFAEPPPSFFMDYLAVMALFVGIGHYLTKGIATVFKRKQEI